MTIIHGHTGRIGDRILQEELALLTRPKGSTMEQKVIGEKLWIIARENTGKTSMYLGHGKWKYIGFKK